MKTRTLLEVMKYKINGNQGLNVNWVKKSEGSFLSGFLPKSVARPPLVKEMSRIESIADETNKLGAQPLWQGYGKNHSKKPNVVRSHWMAGCFFSDLASRLKPEVVVEFGSAFGVSGMYWLSGLENSGKGKLYSFEPNTAWAEIAEGNLLKISNNFLLTRGTFEENVQGVLGDKTIDLAFIDAIHTREFVLPQVEIVLRHSSPHSILVLDDINFSDNMEGVWKELSQDDRFIASASVGDRIGLLEYNPSAAK